jgi:hypothetical protein
MDGKKDDTEEATDEVITDEGKASDASKHIKRGDIIVVQTRPYRIMSVYELGHGAYRIVPSTMGGDKTVVHATLGKWKSAGTSFVFECLDETSFEGANNGHASDRFVILKGITCEHLYDPFKHVSSTDASTTSVVKASKANSKKVPAPGGSPRIVPHSPGTRCSAKFQGSFYYFFGYIVQYNGNGTYHIQFDADCDEDLSVPSELIRISPVIEYQVNFVVYGVARVPRLTSFSFLFHSLMKAWKLNGEQW